MNLKEFKGQILNELPNCTEDEIRELIPNLLTKLEGVYEGKNKLIEDVKELKEQNSLLENKLQNPDIVKDAAIKESEELIHTAKKKYDAIIHDANLKADQLLQDAKEESDDILAKSILKVQNAVAEIECIDQQQKVFRSHILSLFKHNIFKFSDSEYYFVKSVDDDLQALLSFFEKDERIKRIYEKNMKKLNKITKSMENFDPTCEVKSDDEVIDEESNHNDLTKDDYSDHKSELQGAKKQQPINTGHLQEEDNENLIIKDENSSEHHNLNNKNQEEQVTDSDALHNKKKSPSFLDLINSINDLDK